MFARVAVASVLALPLLAAAQSCNTGPIQCCNSVEKSDSAAGSAILSLLGVVLGDITGSIGLGCSPLSVVGLGQSSCSASPVCCQNNNVGGLISIGCLPIEL
ncbi:fungal hydrophobin [Trametes versicolor FP-101664 SS1]|uniref:fungal hydrophobin n=1 Tax=Trametes versicolor (strain FP-101664) TaxID=717944 RepID=UPI0004623FE0|nr:fungal hydrophobin [Trametes versicolor FP-101664 SS1]EIW55689.1 fungal hydrophobin [Trametes versicolor FP-101664 SS1]